MKKFIAIGLIGVATCSAMAAFVRQATEEYPGGGGGGGDVTKAYVDAADLAVTNYVKASFLALGGSLVSGPMKGRIDFKDGTTNKGSIGWHTGAFSVSAYGAALDFYANLGTASEKKSSLTPDGTAVVTSDMMNNALSLYQTNLVVSTSTADKVLMNDGTSLYWGEGGGGGNPLAGAKYNFHNGTNFNWCIYSVVTNALVKMGATIQNPPAIDETGLVNPIVQIAVAPGQPLSGKTYDFHSGANFVKDVYQVVEQAVRDLGATTINTPTF